MTENQLIACIALMICLVSAAGLATDHFDRADRLACRTSAIEQHIPVEAIEKLCK